MANLKIPGSMVRLMDPIIESLYYNYLLFGIRRLTLLIHLDRLDEAGEFCEKYEVDYER